MSSLETALALEADEEAVTAFLTECGGRLVRDEGDPATYWAEMHPASAPHETYFARVAWAAYPDRPPSVRFCEAIGGRFDVRNAWPSCPGVRPDAPQHDICASFTAEGFQAHQEWTSGPQAWVSEGNPFAHVIQSLQHMLDHQYGGRHQ
ncbi:MAG: hypothetical protein JWL76_1447 [Thermoleophilia bacterium]|nr:hypothetical protein [Thermoleophilia bacterium]